MRPKTEGMNRVRVRGQVVVRNGKVVGYHDVPIPPSAFDVLKTINPKRLKKFKEPKAKKARVAKVGKVTAAT